MSSGGSLPQGVPKARKKAGFVPTEAVCRSGTRLPVHSRASPTRRENRNGFPSGGRLYCGQAGEYLSGTPLRSAQSPLFCGL